jgi:predicted HD superfamily hydrolase involved in NAD metabolism
MNIAGGIISMDYEYEIQKYNDIISTEITKNRLEHSYRVAELIEEFSIQHQYPFPRKAYLAGLLHDIAKQKKTEELIPYFEKFNFPYWDYPKASHHAFGGAFYLKEVYKFEDEEILSSISNHTLGGKNLGFLDKLLYFSDFLGSEYAINNPNYSLWKKESLKNIYYGVYIKSYNVIHDLIENKEAIHINTFDVYNESINELKKEKENYGSK